MRPVEAAKMWERRDEEAVRGSGEGGEEAVGNGIGHDGERNVKKKVKVDGVKGVKSDSCFFRKDPKWVERDVKSFNSCEKRRIFAVF